jgi:hypothetical protein
MTGNCYGGKTAELESRINQTKHFLCTEVERGNGLLDL